MANKQIVDLTTNPDVLAGTEVIEIQKPPGGAGTSFKETVSNLRARSSIVLNINSVTPTDCPQEPDIVYLVTDGTGQPNLLNMVSPGGGNTDPNLAFKVQTVMGLTFTNPSDTIVVSIDSGLNYNEVTLLGYTSVLSGTSSGVSLSNSAYSGATSFLYLGDYVSWFPVATDFDLSYYSTNGRGYKISAQSNLAGNGGSVEVSSGNSISGGQGGDIKFTPGRGDIGFINGRYILSLVPTSDPVQSDALFSQDGILSLSGATPLGPGAFAPAPLAGSAVYDPPNLLALTGATTTIAVPGAALGDFVEASFDRDLQGVMLDSWVSAADVVSVRFFNLAGIAVDVGAGTLKVKVTAPD